MNQIKFEINKPQIHSIKTIEFQLSKFTWMFCSFLKAIHRFPNCFQTFNRMRSIVLTTILWIG